MFQRKTPKLQKPDKTPFTAYNPHSLPLTERKWPEIIRIISIDPGIRNYALRVESRGIKSSTYPIRTIVFDKLHIKDKERYLDDQNVDRLYDLLTNFLDQYLEIFKTCHLVLVERQLPHNYKATRVSQHTLSYFMIKLKNIVPNLAMIVEVDPKLKGRELGAPNTLNERGIKVWAIDMARELMTKRRDQDGLEVLIKHKKKADDIADTLCQIEAFFSYNGWPLTQKLVSLKFGPLVTDTMKKSTKDKEKKILKLKVLQN